MAIRFRAKQAADYLTNGREVKESFSKNPFEALSSTLTSTHIFGSRSEAGMEEKSAARDNVRGYISLCKPVTNQLLAQANASLLAKILGIEAKLAADICSFRTFWSPTVEDYVSIDYTTSPRGLLCGAEIFYKLIEEFDIDLAIRQEFQKIFLDARYKTPGELTKRSGKYLLAGEWYWTPKVESDSDQKLLDYIRYTYFASDDTRLTYLLNMTDKSNLFGMLMEHVSVLPIGMRPDIGTRHDKLSQMYASIITANNNLRLVANRDCNVNEYVGMYRALDEAVNILIWKENLRDDKQKPVAIKLSAKGGFIRSKMLGKRIDHSGRSVITIDPFLGIRNIRIPKAMAPKLFRHHILKAQSRPNLDDVLGIENNEKCCEVLEKNNILKKVPVIIGRQPTLHKLSMQAYEAELTDERSIQVNPLLCPAFNADFDGDQMWARVPCSDEAVEEVRNLMLTTQNIFLPKNGKCTLVPRQEMIYGLNVCTRSTYQIESPIAVYDDLQKLTDDVLQQDIKVYNTVSYRGVPEIAGKLLVRHCLPSSLSNFPIVEITKKTIDSYVDALLEKGIPTFEKSIDALVALGFRIGYLYPPTLDVLGASSDVGIFDQFHKNMEEPTMWYERGFDEDSSYEANYDREFSVVKDKVEDSIYDTLGQENGFVRLAASGARGSKSNLVQMYAYKGRIQKSATETFRAVIEHSYIDQLLPIEHFVTAYGGRKGLIDKSLNTADTGYAMRQMWHAANNYVITSNDCGTSHGIVIKKSDIAMFVKDPAEVDRVFKYIITGRYQAKSNQYITKQLAEQFCKTMQAVEIRSPITCSDPCCRKCYGDDLSTNQDAVIGLPIGFIAAHSIGEPGTQLSMDSFKKGGVANKGVVISAFDKMEAYVNVRSLRDNTKVAIYDPIAWESGPVNEKISADGTKTVTIEGSRKRMTMPADALLKPVAVKGEGLAIERGDYDINELVKYAGLPAAQLYLIHTLYNIYREEAEVSMKHFEVLVAAMTVHMVIQTDRADLKVGQFHDSVHLRRDSLDRTTYVSTLKGIQQIQTLRPLAMSSIIMERVREGLSRAVLLEMEDPLEYPLQRIMLGLKPYVGTHYQDYMNNRRI